MAASSIQTLQTLNSLFKTVYADKVVDLIPEFEVLMKSISFVSNSQKNGGFYTQPVIVGKEHGVTFLGSDESVLQLEDPIVRPSASAQIKASAIVLRSMLSYTAASRCVKGDRAFVDGTRFMVEGLVKSFSCVQESVHWYGGMGYGSFTATTTDLGNKQITIDNSEFAEALWVGSNGMPVQIYNAGGSLVAEGEVVTVDMSTRKITLTSVGTMTNGTAYTIYRRGSKDQESLGMHKILANTGSLFGIDGATYDQWKANQYAVNGACGFGAVSEAIAFAQGRGLQGKLNGYINPLAFRAMISDYNTLKEGAGSFKSRSFTTDSGDLVHGAKSIKFYVNSVEVDFEASNYVKRGYGFLTNLESFLRVGSQSPSFNLPGMAEGETFLHRPNSAAYELRMYSDEGLLCVKPADNILLTGIQV